MVKAAYNNDISPRHTLLQSKRPSGGIIFIVCGFWLETDQKTGNTIQIVSHTNF